MLLGGPNMDKFEQVSSDYHQVSLAEGLVSGLRVPMSDVQGSLYSEVQCIMSNGHIASPQKQNDR